MYSPHPADCQISILTLLQDAVHKIQRAKVTEINLVTKQNKALVPQNATEADLPLA